MSSHSLAMCCSAKQRDDLLAFAKVLDEKLVEIAQRFDTRSSSFGLSVYCIEETHLDCLLDSLESTPPSTFRKVSSGPRSGKGGMQQIPRASSLVENLNSSQLLLSASAAGTTVPGFVKVFPQPSHIYAQ